MCRIASECCGMTTAWRWSSICAGCSKFFRGPAFKFGGDHADRQGGLRGRDLEGGMKSRLSSTIWMLVLLNAVVGCVVLWLAFNAGKKARGRSEEHTSELQSHSEIVCRLLLEQKNETSLDESRMMKCSP